MVAVPTQRSPGRVVLDLDTLVPYLLEHQLLTSRDVVDAPLEIRDHSRRNRSFKVVAPQGESLLVKQAGALDDPEFRASLASEAALLRAFETEPTLAPLRPLVPRHVSFDPASCVLATELVHPATSITKYHLNRGAPKFEPDAAQSCARILADLHVHGAKAVRAGALDQTPVRVPFIWDAFRTMDRVQEAGAGVYRVWLLVKERGGSFWSKLDEIRQAWSTDATSLAHMDVRWDNFLLTHGNAPRGMPLNVRLIDWELSGRGDPAWDVACCLSEYVRFAISHANVREGDTPADLPTRQRYPTALGHESSRAFWATYVKRGKMGAKGEAALRARVETHLPFTMLLIATEIVQRSDVVKPSSRMAFELALQAADAPDAFMRDWFGLEAGAP